MVECNWTRQCGQNFLLIHIFVFTTLFYKFEEFYPQKISPDCPVCAAHFGTQLVGGERAQRAKEKYTG